MGTTMFDHSTVSKEDMLKNMYMALLRDLTRFIKSNGESLQ